MKKIFDASQFVATQWEGPEQKAKFANHFVHFIESGYNANLFHKWFYTRLSNTFGHIAHYNVFGFYDTWFSDREKQKHFLRHTLNSGGYGDPAYTYSDVEKVLKAYLKNYTEKGESYKLL